MRTLASIASVLLVCGILGCGEKAAEIKLEKVETQQLSTIVDTSQKNIPIAKLAYYNDALANYVYAFTDEHVLDDNDPTYSFSAPRQYQICTFQKPEGRQIVLMTTSPIALVPGSTYSDISYMQLKNGITADQFIKTYVNKNYQTLDNYTFDKRIEGIITSLNLEVKQ